MKKNVHEKLKNNFQFFLYYLSLYASLFSGALWWLCRLDRHRIGDPV